MTLLYKKIDSFYSYSELKKNMKELTYLGLLFDLGELSGKELVERGVPLAEEDKRLEVFIRLLCEMNIPEAKAIRNATPEKFYENTSDNDTSILLAGDKTNAHLRERFINVLAKGRWPDNYTEQDTLDALADVFAEPDIKKAVKEIPVERELHLIKFLDRAEKDKLIQHLKGVSAGAEKQKQEEVKARVKKGIRSVDLAPYLEKDDPYFDTLLEEVSDHSHGTGRRDKLMMQHALPFVDIQKVLAGGFWSKATPMNRLALLAHPDLPEEYFLSAMKLLGVYFNDQKNRIMSIKIGRKLDWDDIRGFQSKGIGVGVFISIKKVENKGAPLTEDELKAWAFPELIKKTKTEFDNKLKCWIEHLQLLRNPEIPRLSRLNLDHLNVWRELVQDKDRAKALEITKKVLSDKDQWAELTDEIKSIEPNLLELHFTNGVPEYLGPSTEKTQI